MVVLPDEIVYTLYMRKKKTVELYTKVIDDNVKLPDKQGNGILKYSVSVNKKGKLMRYSLAYINFNLCTKDNGRVIGYDNCHGHHHMHYMGKEKPIEFTSFEDIHDQFENEWRRLHDQIKSKKNH